MSACAVRRSSPSTYGCRCRRCVRTAGPTFSFARTSRDRNAAPAAIRRATDVDGTMTLRCGVGRIVLPELIEPAERDATAELADALHDVLDSATPASSSNGSEWSASRFPVRSIARMGNVQ